MAAEFAFGTENERICVRILAFESTADKESVVEWLDSTVSVNIGAFLGSFKAGFTTQDLMGLYEQLNIALTSPSGKVSFKNTGGDLSLSIEFDDRGHAIARGVIQPHRLPQGILHFRLDMAQSDLIATSEELHDALREFPVGKNARSAS